MPPRKKKSEPVLSLDSIEKSQQELEIKKHLLLEKSLNSTNPEDIMKAQAYLKNIENREESDRKSYFVDPLEFQSNFNYKDKPTNLSYGMLRSMAKIPIINAIIRTRVNQVAAFAEPQRNRYSIGYRIKKKSLYGQNDNDKVTKEEEKEIEELTHFINNCGDGKNFEHDDFDTFIRKIVRDSLTYDQCTFEVTNTKRGVPHEFIATDASTYRLAESFDDDTYQNERKEKTKIQGYYPSYVQIYQSEPVAEFYPWELCFGVRNPATEINMNGYGLSELEEMVTTVTSMLHGEEYNRRFFKNGSVPKGMIRIKGGMPPNKVQEFRQQWNATMRGVQNFWKTPILESDQAEWIDLQSSNRDMEYSAWMEYLIKLACALYCIDPAEINFPLSGGSEAPMFEGNNEARLRQSKDKGLYPLLKFIQKRINKYIIERKNPKFEFEFVGLDAMTPKDEQDLDIAAVRAFKTVNEVRKNRGMKEVEGGDIILDGIYTNAMLQEQQNQQMEEQGGMGEEGEEGQMPEMEQQGEENSEEGGENQVPDFLEPVGEESEEEGENALAKAFEKFMNEELTEI